MADHDAKYLCTYYRITSYNVCYTKLLRMGAIARVACHYQDKTTFFEAATTLQIPIYGTFLEGENIYSEPLNPYGIIVMGNEGKGISEQLHRYITHKLFIPPYPIGGSSSESLNVSVATAIVCSEFRRRLG